MAKQQNSGSSSSKSLTPEQHAERRRAQKARQNAAARAAAASKSSSTDAQPQDNKRQSQKTGRTSTIKYGAALPPKEREARENEVKNKNFRVEQAIRAIKHPDVSSLTEGSLAQKVALHVITLFPEVEFDRRQTGRESAAIAFATYCLSPDERRRKSAVRLGIQRAHDALKEAFETLTRQPQVATV